MRTDGLLQKNSISCNRFESESYELTCPPRETTISCFPAISMHLSKIKLNNFRCFESLEVPLHPRLTVLVAENGGGKTAVLDGIAIGLAQVARALSSANQRLAGPAIKDSDFHLRLQNASDAEPRWRASDYSQIILETADGREWDQWRPGSKGKQPEYRVSTNALPTFTGILDDIAAQRPVTIPVFAYYGARRGLIEVPERLRRSKKNNANYEFPTSALLGALNVLSDFKEMLMWFNDEEAAELRANKDSKGEDYYTFPSLDQVRSTIEILLGGGFIYPRFNRRHKFVVSAKNGPSELSVDQLSQGYQSMLALGMDFSRRLAIANPHLDKFDVTELPEYSRAIEYFNKWQPGPPEVPEILDVGNFGNGPALAPAIMLIDEVDLHLHPSWQQRVIPDLMRAFPHTQFIVTTHSPQVLSTTPAESIRIIKDGILHSSPPGTDGAEAQRILEEVFFVSPRPLNRPIAKVLDDYLRLVDERKGKTGHALDLRAILDQWSQGNEPSLLEADLKLENLDWEAGK